MIYYLPTLSYDEIQIFGFLYLRKMITMFYITPKLFLNWNEKRKR